MLGDPEEPTREAEQTENKPNTGGKRLSFEEAADAAFAQYDESFRRLADAS